jgi:hypothetical protein
LGKLIAKMFLLSAPVIMCGMFVLYVDPFNYFRMFKGIPVDKKKEIVYYNDRLFWNMIEYDHAPSPCIIIGDSRADRISSEHLKEKTRRQYKHLSASACKINEMADLFWFANSYTKLESVYIVINFNIFNLYAFDDRIAGAETTLKNPLLYAFNRHVIDTAVLIFKSIFLTHETPASKKPTDKDDFWDWSLRNWPNQQYGKWKYPSQGYEKLRQMSDYCHKENIDLVFIIAPHHADYQKMVGRFNLSSEQKEFKNDISALSTTYDFDFVNELTENRDNFSDPAHVTMEVANKLIDEILTGKFNYGRLLKSQ